MKIIKKILIPNSKLENRNSKGFTLLELLIVIGLLVIFTVMTVPYTFDFFSVRVLEEDTSRVANVLQRAQSNAKSGRDDSDWGVRFFQDEGRYEIFRGDDCEEGTTYQTFRLSAEVDIEGVDCIIFERHSGDPQIIN